MNPSDFTDHPYNSICRKCECETVARNIMAILERHGNKWKLLTWEEYERQRIEDGDFTLSEKSYFDRVVKYCQSAGDAITFSPEWAKVAYKIAETMLNQSKIKKDYEK